MYGGCAHRAAAATAAAVGGDGVLVGVGWGGLHAGVTGAGLRVLGNTVAVAPAGRRAKSGVPGSGPPGVTGAPNRPPVGAAKSSGSKRAVARSHSGAMLDPTKRKRSRLLGPGKRVFESLLNPTVTKSLIVTPTESLPNH